MLNTKHRTNQNAADALEIEPGVLHFLRVRNLLKADLLEQLQEFKTKNKVRLIINCNY